MTRVLVALTWIVGAAISSSVGFSGYIFLSRRFGLFSVVGSENMGMSDVVVASVILVGGGWVVARQSSSTWGKSLIALVYVGVTLPVLVYGGLVALEWATGLAF